MFDTTRKWIKRVWQSRKRHVEVPQNQNGHRKKSPVDGLILYMTTMYLLSTNVPPIRTFDEDERKRR
jgi:hypothetical protein